MPITRKTLAKTVLALILCSILVWVCYEYVDRPVIYWAYQHIVSHHGLLLQFTYISSCLWGIALLALVLVIIRAGWLEKPLGHFSSAILAMCVSLMIATFIKDVLKFVFGRYWPLTWTHNNPSLIHDDAYGFHFFHSGGAYQSFPSGHTTAVFAVMVVLWIAYPMWRWLSVLACLLVMMGLVGLSYHFVSDIIAGAFLGSIVAVYTTRMMGVTRR